MIVLWIGIGVIVLMCLFPPWMELGESEEFLGDAFLFKGPLNGTGGYLKQSPRIDSTRLMIRCAIVGLITVALLYTLKNKKSETGGK